MFSTGTFGSRSWAITTSQNAPSVLASGWVKKRISGTLSMRSSTTRRVTSSQWSTSSSTLKSG